MTSSVRSISSSERRARLGLRHRLAVGSRARTAEEVAESLVALHATDAATVFLSIGARLRDPGHLEVERALYEDRTLARMHGMRQTLFVVPAELAPVVQASTTREVGVRERAAFLKALADGGHRAEWVADVEAAVLAELEARGRASGAELGKAVPGMREHWVYGAGTASETKQALGSRLLRSLGIEGRIVRDRPNGTWTSSQFLWALAPPRPDLPVEEAKAELVRRWLGAYGPGTEADLKWWTGWKVTDVRKALKLVGACEVALGGEGGRGDSGSGNGGGVGYVLPDDEVTEAAPAPWAALLPALDPTPMGWQERGWFLPDEYRAALFDRSGNVGPTVWWNGTVVGGWAQRADGEVVTRLFADFGGEAVAAVEAVAAEAARWSAWVGDIRVTPRFRTPLERELSA